MNILRKIFRWAVRIIFLLAILALIFLIRVKYITDHQKIPASKNIALENPKEVSFEWKYNGQTYKINETLYGSLFNFYLTSPKTYTYQGELPANWEKDYYSMFLNRNPVDDSISKTASAIQNLGNQKKLNADQIVELTLAFVQSIPYDSEKAEQVLTGVGDPSYPYETLYSGKGICSDKSFLFASLLREMGYGASLLAYDAEKHMAVGIKCPQNYSTYDSGYCYAETTSEGFRIGMIPSIDPQKGSAIPMDQKKYFGSEIGQFDAKNLGEAKIFEVSEGKIYEGISNSLSIAKKIDALNQEINSLEKTLLNEKKQIDAYESTLTELDKKMDKLKKKDDWEEYNDLVDDYNDLLKKYKKAIKSYNEKVDLYNQKVNTYNSLVKSF